MREKLTLTFDEKTVEALKEERQKSGIPMSQALERAFLQVRGEKIDEK